MALVHWFPPIGTLTTFSRTSTSHWTKYFGLVNYVLVSCFVFLRFGLGVGFFFQKNKFFGVYAKPTSSYMCFLLSHPLRLEFPVGISLKFHLALAHSTFSLITVVSCSSQCIFHCFILAILVALSFLYFLCTLATQPGQIASLLLNPLLLILPMAEKGKNINHFVYLYEYHNQSHEMNNKMVDSSYNTWRQEGKKQGPNQLWRVISIPTAYFHVVSQTQP